MTRGPGPAATTARKDGLAERIQSAAEVGLGLSEFLATCRIRSPRSRLMSFTESPLHRSDNDYGGQRPFSVSSIQ